MIPCRWFQRSTLSVKKYCLRSVTTRLFFNFRICPRVRLDLSNSNQKAVLSQRWPRDAHYISRSWTVAEIYDRLRRYGHLKFFQDGGNRHLGFVRTGNSAIRSAVPENPTREQYRNDGRYAVSAYRPSFLSPNPVYIWRSPGVRPWAVVICYLYFTHC